MTTGSTAGRWKRVPAVARDADEFLERPAPRSRWSVVGAILLIAAILPVVFFSSALPALGGAAAMVAAGGVLIGLSRRARAREPHSERPLGGAPPVTSGSL